MEQPFQRWYDLARENQFKASRFSFLLVALLVALQLTTVDQFLTLQPRLRRARKEVAEAEQHRARCEEAALAGQKLQQLIYTNLPARLHGWASDLQRAFASVNEEILLAREPDNRQPRNMAVQSIQSERNHLIPLEILSRIQGLKNVKEIRIVLAPFVRTAIVDVAVTALNHNWQLQLQPALEDHLKVISKSLSPLGSSTDTNMTATLADLQFGISVVRSNSLALKFAAPRDDIWWQSVQGKLETADMIGNNAAEQISAKIVFRDIELLQERTRQVATALAKAVAEAEASMKALEKQFEDQKKKAEDLAKPLGFITLDLEYAVSRFPLLLGLGLGTAIFWPAFRKRELTQAFSLWCEADPSVGKWAPLMLPRLMAPLTLVLGAAGAIIWIIVTSVRLSRIERMEQHTLTHIIMLALTPIILSVLYAGWVENQTRKAARTCSASALAPIASTIVDRSPKS